MEPTLSFTRHLGVFKIPWGKSESERFPTTGDKLRDARFGSGSLVPEARAARCLLDMYPPGIGAPGAGRACDVSILIRLGGGCNRFFCSDLSPPSSSSEAVE